MPYLIYSAKRNKYLNYYWEWSKSLNKALSFPTRSSAAQSLDDMKRRIILPKDDKCADSAVILKASFSI